jgi:uncharacterized protein YbjT (DUF2867 family)
MKKAIVIGATGLVGMELITLLLADVRFNKILVIGRRPLKIQNPKLEQHIVEFDIPDTWRHFIECDVLFSALGTTLRDAGGKHDQYKVDYTYQFNVAKAAASNNVKAYVLVSSATANARSRIYYSRMKGELERDIKQLPFESITILQPSLLMGKRNIERPGEKVAFYLLTTVNAMGLFRKHRPISARTVAEAMINASGITVPGVKTYALENIFKLAGASSPHAM